MAGSGVMQTNDAATVQQWQDAISSIIHELKSPTASLKMLLQTLDRRMHEPGSEDRKNHELVQMSLKQTERLTLLINDLLDVTRMEKGHLRYAFQAVQIGPLVESLAQATMASHPEHRFILRIDGDAMIKADPLRIEQALTNIIVNATKYSPANTTITISLTTADEQATITVTDEGIGIAPEQQQHLFDLYYRAPTATNVKGLGIGLPLSYGIVKAHGGDIKVTSVPGQGSTFTVLLPIQM